jgi:BirA family biotin operon repressor/biotin-[acetyl-CoA-carboxylase] ligase
MATPLHKIRLDETASTQDDARSAFDGSPVLVIAGGQTAGRGRSGSAWRNAPRAVAASLAFAPGWDLSALSRMTLVAGLAAIDSLGGDLGLKWPNDVVRDDEKLAGILTEAADGVVVVGMGVNLWWPDPPEGVAGLLSTDPGPDRGSDLAAEWAGGLLTRAASGPDEWGRDEYRSACVTLGRDVIWEPGGSGRAVDIAPDGALLVEVAGTTIALDSGAVTMVRSPRPPG